MSGSREEEYKKGGLKFWKMEKNLAYKIDGSLK